MIIHHIKPEQILALAKMFGKETKSGLVLPSCLLRLHQTAVVAPPKAKDFEATLPPQMPPSLVDPAHNFASLGHSVSRLSTNSTSKQL
jgi:hypothetical protein